MHTFAAVRNELSLDHMLEVAHRIAGWERLSGSAQELEAAHYLEKQLQDYGYETRLLACDAYISLPVSCKLLVNGREVYAQTHSLVPSTRLKAPLIYCENQEAIKQTDCTGKIVLTRGRATYPPVAAAQDAGAIGCIFIQEAVIRECIPSGCWGSPTMDDWKLLPQIPVASVVDDVGDPLAEALNSGEALQADLTTVVDTSWRKIPLLIGELKAPVRTDRFVQLTGHLDSWYYGAIDNGTSNSLQMEMARIVRGHQPELKRNFRVVYYSGHSHGRYAGSAWYSDYFWEDLHENCAVNINTDCAGCKGANDIVHSIVMPETKDLAVQIVRDQTGETFEGIRCGRLGDQSFWNVGLSSAFASFSRQKKIKKPDGTLGYERGNSELGPGWHTPNDVVDYIDPNNLLRDAKIVGEYVMTCLTEPVLPLQFQRTAEEITMLLENWAHMAGDAFDLGQSIARSKELQEVCRRFYETELLDDVRNDTMIKLSRILVPLDFSRGNIYGTEPAFSIDPMPSLTPIRDLVKEGTAAKEKMALKLQLVRTTNYINHSLLQAIRLLQSVL